jgi:hypothetical protein
VNRPRKKPWKPTIIAQSWVDYAEWLEAERDKLRDAAQAVMDKHSRKVTLGDLSYTEMDSEELEALKAALEAGDE